MYLNIIDYTVENIYTVTMNRSQSTVYLITERTHTHNVEMLYVNESVFMIMRGEKDGEKTQMN